MLRPDEVSSPEKRTKAARSVVKDTENSAGKKMSMRERLSYYAIIAGAGIVGTFPFWGNALFKPSDGEIKARYAKAFNPASQRIGRRALQLSQEPNAIFDRSARTRFRRTRISAEVPNKFGNEARVIIEMGQTNGRPDPKKVSSIFLQQPQGGADVATVKTIELTAPRDVTPDVFGEKAAWDGEEREFTTVNGLREGEDRFVDGTTVPSDYPDILGNLTNGLWFDYGDEMGKAQQIADDAEKMFTQIETGIRHEPGQH